MLDDALRVLRSPDLGDGEKLDAALCAMLLREAAELLSRPVVLPEDMPAALAALPAPAWVSLVREVCRIRRRRPTWWQSAGGGDGI